MPTLDAGEDDFHRPMGTGRTENTAIARACPLKQNFALGHSLDWLMTVRGRAVCLSTKDRTPADKGLKLSAQA